MNRRAVLKALGIAPAAAPALAAQMSLVAGPGISAGIGAGMNSLNTPSPVPIPDASMRFTSFTNWLIETGTKDRIENETRWVNMLDPDIASMHLPLNTKFQWQRKRNYERALTEYQRRFDRALSLKGYVERWLD